MLRAPREESDLWSKLLLYILIGEGWGVKHHCLSFVALQRPSLLMKVRAFPADFLLCQSAVLPVEHPERSE